MLYRNCVYPYIFETSPDPKVGKLRKYNAAPHPYVLYPGATMRGHLEQNTEHELYITLFGQGNRQLPYVIHALDRAAQQGLGKQRGKLQLLEVQQHTDNKWRQVYQPGGALQAHDPACIALPDCPTSFTLRFSTPLRLRAANDLVTPDNFTFQALFSPLLRRISLLTAFHTDTPLVTDFAALTQAAKAIPLAQSELRWQDWTRYSSRQKSLMQLGGLLGKARLESAVLAPFWPYLWQGQWTHAGRSTSMGLGKYEITDMD